MNAVIAANPHIVEWKPFSMFSAVVISRAMVNLFYGSRRRLERVAIGNTSWK